MRALNKAHVKAVWYYHLVFQGYIELIQLLPQFLHPNIYIKFSKNDLIICSLI